MDNTAVVIKRKTPTTSKGIIKKNMALPEDKAVLDIVFPLAEKRILVTFPSAFCFRLLSDTAYFVRAVSRA